MSYSQYYNLRPGDRIVLGMYATGAIKHFAIFLGYINGIEYIAENHKGSGVQIVLADYFLSAMPAVFYIERFTGSEQEQQEMIYRALSLQGTQYSLFAFNCEHYANYVQYGVAESKQVSRGIVYGAILIGLLWGR
jgi:hypothetical protein